MGFCRILSSWHWVFTEFCPSWIGFDGIEIGFDWVFTEYDSVGTILARLAGLFIELDRVLIKFDCARPDGLGVYRVFTESTGLGLG